MVQRTIRKKVKVPLFGQPAGKVAQIEDGATMGARFDSTLYYADGSVVTLANLAAALGAGTATATPTIGLARTLWSLIQEIPANIVEAAALNTAGLVTRQTSGDWITRAIAVASTDRLTIANGDGDAGAPTLDLADLEGLSLWGRSLTSTGKPDAITGTANQVARVNSAGTLLGFGAVNLASSDAVTGRLPFANVAQIAGQAVLGVAAAGAADLAAIAAGTNDRFLRQTGGVLNFGQLTAGMFPSLVVPDAALSANVALYNGSTAFSVSQTISGAGNRHLSIRDTSATSGQQAWNLRSDAGDFKLSLANDAGAAQTNAVVVNAGPSFAIDSIDLSATDVRFTGIVTVLGPSSNASVIFRDNNAGSDEKQWRWRGDGNEFKLQLDTDAGVITTTAVRVTRSGTTVPEIELNATELDFNGRVILDTPIRLRGYTVATLPAGAAGDLAYVTDALAPAYNVALVGGGAVTVKAFHNGAAWVAG